MARTIPATLDGNPPSLMWPRPRLAEELTDQIDRGEFLAGLMDELLADDVSDAEIDIVLHEDNPGMWHARNRTILREAFTTRHVLDHYDPGTEIAVDLGLSSHAQRREALAERLGRLRDIAERLDRYDELPGVRSSPIPPSSATSAAGPVFVVHGRDNHTKVDVARTLRQLTGDEPVILHEQPDGGATVIEKFEHHANTAAAAVVILSPDDVGGLADEDLRLQPRARQNVVYELGWFHARLGRGRVIALLVDDVERPSDIAGVLYVHVDPAAAWRMALGRELHNAGIEVDLTALR